MMIWGRPQKRTRTTRVRTIGWPRLLVLNRCRGIALSSRNGAKVAKARRVAAVPAGLEPKTECYVSIGQQGFQPALLLACHGLSRVESLLKAEPRLRLAPVQHPAAVGELQQK